MSVVIKETHNIQMLKPKPRTQIPLSKFDTISCYINLVYFFKNVHNEFDFMNVQKIQNSLRDILTDYHPLTGAIIKNETDNQLLIDCDDRGIPFVTAEGSSAMIEQLEEDSRTETLESFIVNNDILNKVTRVPLLAVQHTKLVPDGSVVIGISIHHTAADGAAAFGFLENWSRKARHEQILVPPVHVRDIFKEDKKDNGKQNGVKLSNEKNNAAPPKLHNAVKPSKRFHFSNDQLNKLREVYSTDIPKGKWVSTNDVIVAHLTRNITRVRNIDSNAEATGVFICAIACNVREKFKLSKGYFGNAFCTISALLPVSKLINGSRSEVALQIRETISKVEDADIQFFEDWFKEKSKGQIPTEGFLVFSNWSKFPAYELDLGYGKPTRFRPAMDLENAIVFSGTANNNGIDAFIYLKNEQLDKLNFD
ncbi:14203_t:CDS:2 [Acaulospora colombiana]|uniref:14203_t:CDS:1 n=1 Tax=Acaulospora colombiana TaxID=27376 RepID=A0ACA9N6N4_9GLOM|nr:14203_t:CDS:2 [Acaulospora colombiana]